LAAVVSDVKRSFRSVAVFSAAVNLLMLAGPLYMLQIYDRVLSSRSVPTLIALSALLLAAYVFQGTLDLIRVRVVARVATALDFHLATTVHAAVVRLGLTARHAGEAQQPLRDLDQIRSFLTSTGPIAFVDLPWAPVFLALCFAIHMWLGVTALIGAPFCFRGLIDGTRQPRTLSRDG
jgi:ABC-type protease/lipase transport system fused ATPase/permease subunit